MRIIWSFIVLLICNINFAMAQDTLYIYKAGEVIKKRAIAEIDSITFSKNHTIPLQELVTDIDGNKYHTVKIGTQTWMVENLRTTKYRNGENITNLKVAADWKNSTTGTWCDYNNDTINEIKYGKLYNWYAVSDSRNIAPQGWHVASDAEWTTLTSYLGESAAGGKLKEAGFQNWANPNTGATNESGFTGLPGGLRSYSDGTFRNLGLNGYFWSNTQSDSLRAWDRELFYNQANCFRYDFDSKRYGFSVRCVKDDASTVTDIDGNVYKTVKIGTQTWMVENLRTTKYRNGENITNLKVAADWKNSTTGTWCDYNNDTINEIKYGKLYNWYAASDIRNIAPQGWHVASDAEWTTLTSYLGESAAGGKLKEAGFQNWANPNTGATNESGFTGLPGGLRSYSDGTFRNLGLNGYFWSNTQSDSLRAWDRELFYNQANCFRYDFDSKRYGFSVRCVKDEVSTVTDIDGNVYKTVKIGTQTWMAEDLKTTRYRNGEIITNLKVANDWKNTTAGAWCNYNNDSIVGIKYGKIYNWYAVTDNRNIAPTGWHVASDAEWTILSTYLGESTAGGKLKETGTRNWVSPNTGATNETGFTAIPGGGRGNNDGTFDFIGTGVFWWTSTILNSTYSYFRSVGYSSPGIGRAGSQPVNGLYVRCVKD